MRRLTRHTTKLVRFILMRKPAESLLMAAHSGTVHARAKMYVLERQQITSTICISFSFMVAMCLRWSKRGEECKVKGDDPGKGRRVHGASGKVKGTPLGLGQVESQKTQRSRREWQSVRLRWERKVRRSRSSYVCCFHDRFESKAGDLGLTRMRMGSTRIPRSSEAR